MTPHADSPSCLVIGAGLLGSRTALELASRGLPTVLFSRSLSPWLAAHTPAPDNLEYVEGLVGDPALTEAADGAEIAFLMAGTSTPAASEARVQDALAGSLMLAVSLMEELANAGVKRMVVASSGGTVYGRVAAVPTPEDHPTRPVSLHGMHALAIESYADFYARRYGIDAVVLRFANVYGPGQRVRGQQGVIAAWCEAALRDAPLPIMGEGDTRRDFVYVDDAAAAAVAAGLDGPANATFNVGGGGSWSLEELRRELESAAGRELRVERTPARPVDVPETHLDIARITEAVGWAPRVSLPDGLRATWDWCQTPVARP